MSESKIIKCSKCTDLHFEKDDCSQVSLNKALVGLKDETRSEIPVLTTGEWQCMYCQSYFYRNDYGTHIIECRPKHSMCCICFNYELKVDLDKNGMCKDCVKRYNDSCCVIL